MKLDMGEHRSKNSIGLLRCTEMTLEVFCGYGERRGQRGLRDGYNMVTPLEWWTWLRHRPETSLTQRHQAAASRMTYEKCEGASACGDGYNMVLRAERSSHGEDDRQAKKRHCKT